MITYDQPSKVINNQEEDDIVDCSSDMTARDENGGT